MGVLSEVKKNRETHPGYFDEVYSYTRVDGTIRGLYTPQTVALLRDMASALRRYGWVQENYGSCKKGFCLVGVLEEESGSRIAWADITQPPTVEVMNELGDLETSVRRALWDFGPLEIGNAPIHWNDQPERTALEVIDMLDSVAQAVEDKLLSEVTV